MLATVVAVGAAAAIAWNHDHSGRRFVRNVGFAMPMSAELTATVLSDWFSVRREWFGPDAAVTYRVEALPTPRIVLTAAGAGPPPRERSIPIAESTFPKFNVAAPDDRSQRTILILREDPAWRVLLVSASGGGPQPPGPRPAVPPGLEGSARWLAALRDPSLRNTSAVVPGIAGSRVVRGIAEIAGTPFVLVRERDEAELLSLLGPSLLITDAIFSLLALLIVVVMLGRWRSAAWRAERDAMALRSTFVSSVSHELRTPLTQIRMYAEMLQLGYLRDDEERHRALDVIAREAGRLGLLVDQALAFVRTGKTPAAPTREPAMVTDAAERAVASLAPLLAERQVTVAQDVPAALTVPFAADALHQVLLNLLANALKYGPPGQTIRLQATTSAAVVCITVDDEGPGIPAAERQRVFRPFVRGTEVSDASGSGIGLAVVQDLVVAAGGSVTVEDPPTGRGARLALRLPAH